VRGGTVFNIEKKTLTGKHIAGGCCFTGKGTLSRGFLAFVAAIERDLGGFLTGAGERQIRETLKDSEKGLSSWGPGKG